MNSKNLKLILQNYVLRFGQFNINPEPYESFKWIAVRDFQHVFDLDAPDFAAMLKKACKATSIIIDNYVQPFSGLVAMAEKKGEAETIRDMFRRLYAEDGGDLVVRQQKITEFISSCDELLAKHYPSSHLYKNDQRSVMGYLWFHDPDHHYMLKSNEAYYLANAIEYYDDWGTYANFKLDVYHRFCDTLVEEIRNLARLHRGYDFSKKVPKFPPQYCSCPRDGV